MRMRMRACAYACAHERAQRGPPGLVLALQINCDTMRPILMHLQEDLERIYPYVYAYTYTYAYYCDL